MTSRSSLMSVKSISNYDGFEKFLRKMSSFKGGWENMHRLLENAFVLQNHLRAHALAWEPENIEKVISTKSGQYLMSIINTEESTIEEVSVRLDYVRQYLADFGIYGFRLVCTNIIEDLS